MKKFLIMAVLSLVAIMAAACGSEVSKGGSTPIPSNEAKKEEASADKESEEKEEVKNDQTEKEAAAPVVNYARNYLEDVPFFTEDQLDGKALVLIKLSTLC
ncbi:Lipoprotein OS=Lysinibacillus sphaericus OX=1421 GN=LS41612_10365 PE=4 SV=1 [Lysinibacillus sphaericus]